MRISTLWKTGLVGAALFCGCCLVSDCASVIVGTGTVEAVDPGKRCWQIVAADGEHYEPTRLPDEYKIDGLSVEFRARPTDAATICMMGEVVELLSIRARPKEK